MELIIAFSGSCLLCFALIAAFSDRINLSLPQNRVLRSLGRMNSIVENQPVIRYSRKEKIQITLHKLINIFSGKKKSSNINDKDIRLVSAGLKNWTSAEWKVLTFVVGLFFSLIAVVISFLLLLSSFLKLELIIIGFILGYLTPNIWLKMKIGKRKDEITRSLPEVLDLIMVSVEAGLGFDLAILKVVEKQKGTLAEEFNIVLQEIRMGRPRRDALKDLAKRNDIDDLSNVIASLVQADMLGISMGGVLRNQSKQIRLKRKQRAQEQAQKAPVKIMIPLVFFIFPSIFIVILGPAIIKLMELFATM